MFESLLFVEVITGLLGSAFFFMIGFATAAVGLGVPTTVAAGPGPDTMVAIFGITSFDLSFSFF